MFYSNNKSYHWKLNQSEVAISGRLANQGLLKKYGKIGREEKVEEKKYGKKSTRIYIKKERKKI
jgi:hypothetical protein